MTTSRPPAPGSRRLYIDCLRGIAVLLMIEAHTFDAWTRRADRRSPGFGLAGFFGGFAAPLFLWLAGVGVALAASRAVAKGGQRAAAVDAVCRRGLEIFILAFLFRLQAFLISPGSHPVTLFRVDILNVMGPSIAAAGLLWAISAKPSRQAVAFGVATVAIAMATPLVRASAGVDALPTWFQWYLRPSGEHTTFTLLPWAGFVFAGAACGVLIAAVDRRSEPRLNAALLAAGLFLIWFGRYTAARPSLYARSSFWSSSPTWFAIRVGVMMTALAVSFALAAWASRRQVRVTWLERFGRHSLFVYWIHVELVYGYASWRWRGRLPLWGTVVGFVLFTALMYGALVLRGRIVGAWRARPRGCSPPREAVTA